MAWSSPYTAVAGVVLDAADYNQYVRDNMNEALTAKAAVEGSYFATSAVNELSERHAQEAAVISASTTTSTSFTDLADGLGPSMTLETGPMALVSVYCNHWADTSPFAAWMGFAVSGDSIIAAADGFSIQLSNNGGQHIGAQFLIDTLTPGMNTFTAKFRVSTGGTALFSSRRLTVMPF